MYGRYSLSNGIKVVTEMIPYVNSISMGIWIKSGSRYESIENNGVSHFIEHMLFKGTQNRNAKQIAEEIEELGGQINAFTGKEATCFYVKLLDEHIDIGIDILSDIIFNSNFSEGDINKEKSVIQEEINMYEDSPEDLVQDLLALSAWGDDTLSYPILGTNKSINNLNRESLLNYFESTYIPENMVISIAGNFDSDHIRYMLEKSFGLQRRYNKIEKELTTPEIHRNVFVKNKDIEQTHISLSLKGIELGNEKLYTLLAINNYFGGNTSSKLFQNLREDKGYVYTIYSFPSSYINAGMFNIYFALNSQYINEAIGLIEEEMQSILVNKMNDIEIKKAKEQLKGNYILGLESISSRMFSTGKSELMLQKLYEPKEILKQIDNITKEDVDEVIDLIFGQGILSIAVVGRNISEDRFINHLRR